MAKILTVVLFCSHCCLVAKAVKIQQCGSGRLTVEEDDPLNIVCEEFAGSETVTWSIIQPNSTVNVIGSCAPSETTCQSSDLDISLSRASLTRKSNMTMNRNPRQKLLGTSVKCEAGKNKSATCNVRIINPGEISSCNLTSNVETWRVNGTCLIQATFLSDGSFRCQWYQSLANQSSASTAILPERAFTKTAYNVSGRSYYRGYCSVSHPLPAKAGVYTYFLKFTPGTGPETAGTINIKPPGDPVTDCPQYVDEGDTLTCFCNTSRPGQPPPVLRWLGMTGNPLVVNNIQMQQDGVQYTCRQTWGGQTEAVKYTLQVRELASFAATVESLTVNGKTGSMTVITGDTTPLILRCAARGRPKPSIRVVRVDTGQPLEIDTSHTSGQDENVQQYTLTTSARCQDAAIYRCEASNTEGRNRQEFTLFVNCAPSQGDEGTVQNPLHLFVMDGTKSMTFNVVAFPTPLVSSVVFLGSSLPVDDNSEQGKTSDVLNARCVPTAAVFQSACTVTADKRASEDEGFYTVTVENQFGEASYIIQLSLAPPGEPQSVVTAFPAAAVGGGVAAVVVVVVLVVVGVLVYRKYFGNDTYDRPMPRQEEDNYTDLVLYEDIGSKQEQTGTDHTYENDAAI